jgi:hypothetical protein
MVISILRMVIGAVALPAVSFTSAAAQLGDAFEVRLRNFLDDHCVACHGPDIYKRQRRLDQSTAGFDYPQTTSAWVKVVDRLSAGAMPPTEQPRPDDGETRAVYIARPGMRAHVEPVAVRRELLQIPLFQEPESYVDVPLETTYQAAYLGGSQCRK